MREREPYNLAIITAEAMYNLWEMESQRDEPDLDAMMRRLKDLSAYSLTHAEILQQREGVEMLALAMFFGATNDPAYHDNQTRLQRLSEKAISYEGRSEKIEKEVAQRKKRQPAGDDAAGDSGPAQPRLL